ncbi:helitron_like_N domain-containing protein [Trichonephila clavipes]|uniref:Helitron_like_N domain-containing protein n=1 Tax=Trichonephila clavipes TaxID=2585209 RepID=A0A8X6VAI6_TRICX|nr:helitron_like_N domain-containing protein [Trichonephila clavipes]
MKVARLNETFPLAELRRLEQAEREALHRAVETPELSQARLLQQVIYIASQTDTETVEAAESRRRAIAERAQRRRQIFTRNTLLLLQFLVSMYVKVESERLRFIALNQTKLRVENYIHLQDAIRNDAELDPNNLGQMVILPSSFVYSVRYLHEYTQDAFISVRNYGRTDLFITMTCNPAWPEITRKLIPGQNSMDRHDLTARVFKIKVQKLVALLTKGKIFGNMKCFMYSIERQKRGLPHVHLLLRWMEKLRPNQIDEVISAEIPNP